MIVAIWWMLTSRSKVKGAMAAGRSQNSTIRGRRI